MSTHTAPDIAGTFIFHSTHSQNVIEYFEYCTNILCTIFNQYYIHNIVRIFSMVTHIILLLNIHTITIQYWKISGIFIEHFKIILYKYNFVIFIDHL